MNTILTAAAAALTLSTSVALTNTAIVAKVDSSNQQMIVEVDGEDTYTWPVSTAREGKETPLGIYNVEWLSAKHKVHCIIPRRCRGRFSMMAITRSMGPHRSANWANLRRLGACACTQTMPKFYSRWW